jgi:hypothetical protein
MPVEYAKKPEGGDIRDNLKNVPMSDQLKEASGQYSKYMPSAEEIKKIAKLIEKTTKMEVSQALKDGKVGIKFVTREEAARIQREEALTLVEKYVQTPQLREKVIKGVMEYNFVSNTMLSFFDSIDNSLGIVVDNFEGSFKRQCEERLIEPDGPKGIRFRKFMLLDSVTHEFIHNTIKENSPSVGNARLNALIEMTKIISENVKDGQSVQIGGEPAIRLLLVKDRSDAMLTYNEGVTSYATHKITSKLGYADLADRWLRGGREEGSIYSDGIKFLEAVQVETAKNNTNPIELTIKHPPTSMMHIKNPEEYLKDVREGML